MRIALVCIWCLLTTTLFGQNNGLDIADKSTAMVDSLNQLGYNLWIRDPSQSVQLGEKAFSLANALKYDNGAAFAKRISGVAH